MSFLKQLLNPFVEFDEEQKKETQKSSQPIVNKPPANIAQPAPVRHECVQ